MGATLSSDAAVRLWMVNWNNRAAKGTKRAGNFRDSLRLVEQSELAQCEDHE